MSGSVSGEGGLWRTTHIRDQSLITEFYPYKKGRCKMLKDRQQETESGLRYLTLFSRYCLHINILYMK